MIEYEVYDLINKEMLNLSYCSGMKTEISTKVAIDENNLFKNNPDSEYYQDICFPYTTKDKTDIILKDRKNEYINNNLGVCEKNCQYKTYNKQTKKVSCDCDIKLNMLSFSDILNKKDELQRIFMDIKTIINIEVIKCYKLFLCKEGIKNNIGSHILLGIIFVQIISVFTFTICEYNSFIQKAKIILGTCNKGSSKTFKKNKNKNIIKKTKNKRKGSKIKIKKNNLKNPPKKKKKSS